MSNTYKPSIYPREGVVLPVSERWLDRIRKGTVKRFPLKVLAARIIGQPTLSSMDEISVELIDRVRIALTNFSLFSRGRNCLCAFFFAGPDAGIYHRLSVHPLISRSTD